MPKKRTNPLPRSECLCAICWEILLEPVTLPCRHTLCSPCFQMTVEKANLCCPFCRLRVSTWARHNARSGTLVDKELWEIIQRQYPEECNRRACGLDTGEDQIEDGFTPQICEPGEIRKEYETEITKVEAERLRIEEEERKASEEYIQKLLAEEEAEQQLSADRSQRELEEQLKKDEELAWMLSSDLNESTASSVISIVESPVIIHKKTAKTKSGKGAKGNGAQSGDIERFLSPKSGNIFGTKGCSRVRNLENMRTGAHSVSTLLVESDDDTMPTLSPQSSFNSSPIEESYSESKLPGLTKYSSFRSAFSPEESHPNKGLRRTVTNEAPLTMATADFSPPRCSSSGKWQNPQCLDVTSMPEQWPKLTPKRTLNLFGDTESQPSEKRPCLENSTTLECHTELLMELEETLHERKLQEEQDRLLALKLQRMLDKEVKQVSRQKGSPDEYKLRTKSSDSQQSPMESVPPKRSASGLHNTDQTSSESGESSDENKKPTSKKHAQSFLGRDRRKTGQHLSPNGEKILKPSNKQQTILDMFQQKSTRK